MARMVFPIEEPDFETFCYDVEILTRDAVNMVCQIFGFPSLHVPIDTKAIDSILDTLWLARSE